MYSVIYDVGHGLLHTSNLRLQKTTCANNWLTARVTFIMTPLTNQNSLVQKFGFYFLRYISLLLKVIINRN